MGLGKSVSTLTAIADLLDRVLIRGALVIAPRRVCELVWMQEARKWSHLAHLKVCVLRGNKAVMARNLMRPFDVWVINYEMISSWLFPQLNKLFFSQGRYLPFDAIVFDECTRVKNIHGARISPWYGRNTNGHCMMDHFPRRVGLTGTPAPNGYIDLHGQYFAVDGGARLGPDPAAFKSTYFIEDVFSRKIVPAKGSKEQIERWISDITLSMTAEEYLHLPPYVYNDLWVELPDKARRQYDTLEREMFLELGADGTIEVFNAAALTAKCRQLANGTMIDPAGGEHAIAVHDAKLEALDEVMEEAGGSGVLVAYQFRVDLKRILERYKRRYTVAYLGPGVSEKDAIDIVDRWNAGALDMLVTHEQSAGHGLNLQHGGHQIAWMGTSFSLEGWLQLNARLRRQGQDSEKVIVHRIMARDTVDEVCKTAIDRKESDQRGLHNALVEYQRKRGM
jgi:SNF2 family DNA or RNA helicase